MTTKSYFEKLEKQYGVMTFGGRLKAWQEAEIRSASTEGLCQCLKIRLIKNQLH